MTDPRVLSALLVISAFVAALIVVTYKVHRARSEDRAFKARMKQYAQASGRIPRCGP